MLLHSWYVSIRKLAQWNRPAYKQVLFIWLQEYKFVVTARDGAPDPRLATATVTVTVEDVQDEVPIFHLSSYEASVKENVPDYMVLQVTVSAK